jgi:hypothetical protein
LLAKDQYKPTEVRDTQDALFLSVLMFLALLVFIIPSFFIESNSCEKAIIVRHTFFIETTSCEQAINVRHTFFVETNFYEKAIIVLQTYFNKDNSSNSSQGDAAPRRASTVRFHDLCFMKDTKIPTAITLILRAHSEIEMFRLASAPGARLAHPSSLTPE